MTHASTVRRVSARKQAAAEAARLPGYLTVATGRHTEGLETVGNPWTSGSSAAHSSSHPHPIPVCLRFIQCSSNPRIEIPARELPADHGIRGISCIGGRTPATALIDAGVRDEEAGVVFEHLLFP